jgi:TolB protein
MLEYMKNWLIAACGLLCVTLGHAQFRVEVSGVGTTQIPVAVTPFRGNDVSVQKIAAIIQADLERSGVFRSIDVVGAPATDETTGLQDPSFWRKKGADALVSGSVTRLPDGRMDVRFRLWDVARNENMGGVGYSVAPSDMRMAAHKIADYVYEKLTGEKAVFSTRIAYVTKNGTVYTLWVADADGENASFALRSNEPIISPAWSPTGSQLAYVSFEARKPSVYVHDVETAKRRLVANFKGSNSAPTWSPDGRTLAVTLSRDNGSQIFLLDAMTPGAEPRRITTSSAIDTEPTFSSDGKTIYFVSDRGGTPQIYKMGATGANVERVTFSGNYNISPTVSPDGKLLAFVSRVSGAFKVHVLDLASGTATAITDTSADEKPSFSANGRQVLYASEQQGKEVLMMATVDGKVKSRLVGSDGDIRQPHWGPAVR